VPRSRNKYSRARVRERSRRTRHQRSSRWFYIAIAAIVIVGVAGVVIASGGTESSAGPPQPGQDHWHAAFGVNICGEWLSNPATFESPAGNPAVRAGIHTHGDGFIHIHPYTRSESGSNATLGKFMKYGGWSVSENSLSVWEGPNSDPTKTTWSNGDKCPSDAVTGAGKPGEVVFEVNCKTVTGNPSDHKLADQEVVALGFVPKGQEIGPPPNAASAPQDDSGGTSTPKAINQKECRPSATNNPGVPDTGAAPTTVPSTPATSTPATSTP
jgi:hypothetical protein